MSRDIVIVRFDPALESLADMSGDASAQMLGAQGDVRDRIDAAFPGTVWRQPHWGVWSDACGTIEFNVGADDPVGSVMLHVRADDPAASAIAGLCVANGWQGIDTSAGQILDRIETAGAGPLTWRDVDAAATTRGD